MKSLFKRIAGEQPPGEGDAPGLPQVVVNSVHSLFQRFTGSGMPPRDETLLVTLRQPSGSSPEVNVNTTAHQPSAVDPSGNSGPAKNEPSSALGHTLISNNPVERVPRSTVQTDDQNGRRSSFDPLQRYFSPRSHSFPDYGNLKSDGKMGPGLMKRFNDIHGPKPVNTMSSSKTRTIATSSRASTDQLSAKRQRLDDSGAYTAARYMPVGDASDISRDQVANMDRPGSLSITSVDEKTWDAGSVKEFRALEVLHDPQKRHRMNNRSRANRARLVHLEDGRDPIQDYSDESATDSRDPQRQTLPTAGYQGTSRGVSRPMADSADLQILAPANRVSRSPPKPNYSHTLSRNKKRLHAGDMGGELDELADAAYDRDPVQKKLNTGPSRFQQAKSSSISTRGDLKPSLRIDQTLDILESAGVPLEVAIWKPDHIFDASDAHVDKETTQPVVLKSGTDKGGEPLLTLLCATSPPENQSKYQWFQLRARQIQRGEISHINGHSSIVKLVVPASPSHGTGAHLYLKFGSQPHTSIFIKWLRQYAPPQLSLTPVPGPKIVQEFTKLYDEIKKRPPPKDIRTITSRANTAASQKTPWPQASVTASRTRQSGRHPIDSLNTRPEVRSGTYSHNQSDDDSALESRPRRKLRSQQDKSSPEPMLSAWSKVNLDWDKNWRLPLSFHRTLVEHDDIPRLDEGECLNDNIIGFYLKYLQLEAEKQRPDTAKRVYFHNSFFYTKLKPTSSRHPINFDGVKNWTSKVDIFSYDYIVVPVNEHFHWWVAIICNPGKLDSTAAQPASSSPIPGEEAEEVVPSSLNGSTTGPLSSPPDGKDVVVQEPADAIRSPDKAEQYRLEDPFRFPDDVDVIPAPSGHDQEGVVAVDDDTVSPTGKSAPHKGRKAGKKSTSATQRKYNPGEPRIVTLDSLGASHSPVCGHLKQYLLAEFKDKKQKDVEYNKPHIGTRATNLPEQDNFCDCGVYLLKYVEEFLRDPDRFMQSILLREDKRWDFSASEMRNEIRQLIFGLHGSYQQEQEEVKRRKAVAKRRRECGQSEVPPESSAPSESYIAAEQAQSPEKIPEPVESTPTPSLRISPVANRRPSPKAAALGPAAPDETEQSKTQSETQDKGAAEPVPYEIRAFRPIDDSQDSTKQISAPRAEDNRIQSQKPIPSIEIVDDAADAPTAPPKPPQSSSPSVYEADDKSAEVPTIGARSKQGHRRKRSGTQSGISAASLYNRTAHEPIVNDSEGKTPAKIASSAKQAFTSFTPPPYPAVDEVLEPSRSTYRGNGWSRHGESPKVKTTYKKARKPQTGGMIDLTDD